MTCHSNLENQPGVDQKLAEVEALLASRPAQFARQGAVVASWRTYGGRRLGPYFRLSYREGGRQRSLYLGRCPERAATVQSLLAKMHARHAQQLACARLRRQLCAALRRHKRRWEREVRQLGLSVQGFEIRGWRNRPARTGAPREGCDRSAAGGTLEEPPAAGSSRPAEKEPS